MASLPRTRASYLNGSDLTPDPIPMRQNLTLAPRLRLRDYGQPKRPYWVLEKYQKPTTKSAGQWKVHIQTADRGDLLRCQLPKAAKVIVGKLPKTFRHAALAGLAQTIT